jgi:hypothetical protein
MGCFVDECYPYWFDFWECKLLVPTATSGTQEFHITTTPLRIILVNIFIAIDEGDSSLERWHVDRAKIRQPTTSPGLLSLPWHGI